jgi:hypothetical protein
MTDKFAKIDISGISYTKSDCEKIVPGRSYILEIHNMRGPSGFSKIK